MPTAKLPTPSTSVIQAAQERLLNRLRAAPIPALSDTLHVEETKDTAHVLWPTADEGPVGESRYEFAEVFAVGGLGVVRRAYDRRLGRVVAVKELQNADSESIRRFVREAVITARLQHPAIVPLYDIGRHEDGEPYYCMKMIDGKSLDQVVAEREKFSERLALVEHVRAAADAIAYAHLNRVIHRDLKPANILVGELGETVVIDWGLAKDLSDTSEDDEISESLTAICSDELTEMGTVMGTLRYMSPEQAQGVSVDERSDVFALGAVLFHVLAGRPPYTGAQGTTLLQRVSHAEVEDLAKIAPDVPELSAIVSKAMAFDPGSRYPTAGAFAEDLRRYINGLLVEAHQYSASEVIRRWIHRHRAVTLVGVLSLLSLGAVGAVAIENVSAERDRAEVALEALTESELRAKESEVDARKHAARASREAKKAQEKSLTLLKDAGRRALDDGRPVEALVPLLEAFEQAPDDRVIRYMVADAMRPVDALRYSLPPDPEGIVRLRTSKTKPRFLSVNGEGLNRLWNADSGKLVSVLATADQSDFFGEDQKVVAIDSNLVVHIYDATSGAQLNSWRLISSQSDQSNDPVLHLLPNASLVVEVQRRSYSLFDLETGRLIGKHKLSSRYPNLVRVVGDDSSDTWVITGRRSLVIHHGSARGTRVRLPLAKDFQNVVFRSDQAVFVLRDRNGGPGLNHHTLYEAGGEEIELENCGGFTDDYGDSFVFVGDGDLLVGRGQHGEVAFWDATNGRCNGSEYGDPVVDVKMREEELVTGRIDGTLALWSYQHSDFFDYESQKYIQRRPGVLDRVMKFRPHSAAFSSLGWLSDGAIITSSAEGVVRVWDIQSSYPHELLAGPSRFWPNPSGSVVVEYSTGEKERLQIISLPSREPLFDTVPMAQVLHAEWLAEHIVLITTRSQVDIWDITRQKLLASVQPELSKEQELDSATPLDATSQVLICTRGPLERGYEISLWNWETNSLQGSMLTNSFIDFWRTYWLSHKNQRILGANGQLFSVPYLTLHGRRQGVWAVFSPDKEYFLTRTRKDKIRLHDGLSGGVLQEIRGESTSTDRSEWFLPNAPSVFFSNEGDRFFAPRNDGILEAWSYPELIHQFSIEGHSLLVYQAIFSDDDQYLFTFGKDQVNWLWDIELEKPIISFRPNGESQAAVFSPQGDVLATFDQDRIMLIELQSGAVVASYSAQGVEKMFFGPEGHNLYMINRNGTLSVTPVAREGRAPSEARRRARSVFPHTIKSSPT